MDNFVKMYDAFYGPWFKIWLKPNELFSITGIVAQNDLAPLVQQKKGKLVM